MAEGQQEGGPKKITVNVKTPKEKESVEIEENATIKEVSANVNGERRAPLLPAPRATRIATRLADRQCISCQIGLG